MRDVRHIRISTRELRRVRCLASVVEHHQSIEDKSLSKMRIFKLIACSLLSGLALGAKSQSKDVFSQFHSKLVKSGPLKLDDATYGRLTTGSRDYSSLILLTAMDPRYGCQVCREFESHYDILSKSWTRGDKDSASRLLFGVLDFSEGRNTFQSVIYISQLSQYSTDLPSLDCKLHL